MRLIKNFQIRNLEPNYAFKNDILLNHLNINSSKLNLRPILTNEEYLKQLESIAGIIYGDTAYTYQYNFEP